METISLLKTMPKTAIITPKIKVITNAEAAISEAFWLSFWPKSLEILLPAPIPKRNPKACIMIITENTTPTAPEALVLI